MENIILLLISGILLLWLGAESFVKGGKYAASFGISPLILGITFGAVATSLPEFAVSWIAAFKGSPQIAVGNASGSIIANTGLALGLGSLIFPLKINEEAIKYDFLFLMISSLLFLIFSADLHMGRLEGVVFLVFFLLYMFHLFKRRMDFSIKASNKNNTTGITSSVFFLLVGAGLIIAGGRMVVSGASAFSDMLGISEVFIGLSITALCTSLPEIALVVAGALRKSHGISLGTIIGSNIYNILLALGGALLISPVEISRREMLFQAPAVIIFTIILFPIMLSSRKINRGEGAFLLLCYAGYIYLMFLT
ncbi:MAG: calcium/sodium antiporter [Elusimicrobiota bacterium]